MSEPESKPPVACPIKPKIKVKMPKKELKEPNAQNEIIKPSVAAAIEISAAAGIPDTPPTPPILPPPLKDEPATCSICIEPFTAKVRRCLTCPYCNENICSQCLEKYLLNTIEDPHCASCRHGWSQSLLQTFCTKTFLTKTYSDYRSNILLNRSKSYLPRYQIQAERIRAAQKYRTRNAKLQEELRIVNEEFSKLQKEYERKRILIWREIHSTNSIANGIEDGVRDVDGNLVDPADEVKEQVQERKKFVRRCPAEGCNGFLSQAWKCGLCDKWTCPECFVVKGLDRDDTHICKDDDKATANEIRKRTKPCPNCGELIEKSEGCDQMFCTSCHSPFSWSRGEIIKTGVIHNPHYFEWLQRNGGTAGGRLDLPCGGLPMYSGISLRIREIQRAVELSNRQLEPEIKDLVKSLGNAYRTCAHIIDVERTRWGAHLRPDEENNNLGVAFLLGNLTEDDWRNRLKINERTRIKSKEIRDILDAFNNAAIDIWRQIDGELIEDKLKRNNFIEKLREWLHLLSQLREFVNPPLLEISRIYNCVVPQIRNDFAFIMTSAAKMRKQARAEAAILAEAEKGLIDAATTAATAAEKDAEETDDETDTGATN